MELIVTTFNGFKLGLSLVKDKPMWYYEDDKEYLWLFDGLIVSLACFEFYLGELGDRIELKGKV